MLSPSEHGVLVLRLGAFLGALAVFACLEAVFPRRRRVMPRRVRWPGNIAVSAINQLVARLFLPMSIVAIAGYSEGNGWGLLNRVSLPGWLEIAIAIVVLDLSLYVQHILFHVVPVFWRFHRMHHADTDFDVTTGIRFHPLSILLSAFIKLAVVLLLGPPAIAVLIFEVLLNATSLFNHSNLRVPVAIERVLRCVVVTPDMHRVHHSVNPRETNSNYGFNFPWWDRWFGTYVAQPALGHEGMSIGLEQFRDQSEQRLEHMLTQPFRGARSRRRQGS